MSAQETTPLLQDRQGLPLHVRTIQVDDYVPITVQVCRSAWPWPDPRALVFVRGAILAYLTALGPILVRNKVAENGVANQTPWSILFDFSTISNILQWLWHLVSFLWSLSHHHHTTAEDDDDGHRWLTRAIFNLSLPDQTEPSSSCFYSSLLYAAAHVFNFINTTMYWAVLVPQGYGNFPAGGGADGTFSHGWLQPFSIVNMYGVTSLIAYTEIMFLNTIKHQHAISSHLLSTMFLLAGYLGWAAIGHTMTGHYPLFWMDPKETGSSVLVAAYASGFVIMGPAAFAALYGLTSMREKLAIYVGRGDGYSRIHDSDDEHDPSHGPGNQLGSRA